MRRLSRLPLMAILAAGTMVALTAVEAPKPKDAAPRIEVAFVLDTTSSMSGLIQAAKDKIWSVANTLATAKPTPQIKMALVAYRDRGDAYVTSVTDLSDVDGPRVIQ